MAKQPTSGRTPVFTINFPNLFEPRTWKDPKTGVEGKPKYGLVALFDKGQDLSELRKLGDAACANEFGPDKAKWPQIPDFLVDQSTKAKEQDGKRVLPPGHVEGAMFMYLDSKDKPVVVDQKKATITDAARIYSGCKCVAAVNAKVWKMTDRYGTKMGIKFYLNGVQLQADGPPLGGFSKAEDLFSPVEDAEGSTPSASEMFN